MKNSLTEGQKAVLRAFYEFGKPMDDMALSIYVHHVEDDPMSSSGIRSRRAELSRPTESRPAYVQIIATKRLKSGRRAAVHALTKAGKAAARRVAEKPLYDRLAA